MENKPGSVIDSTIKYYNDNAKDFISATAYVDLSALYAAFEKNLFSGCHILDLGSGSGRDSRHFIDQGYKVTAVDPSDEMCNSTQRMAGIIPLRIKAEELCFREKFDAIWACASLLHVRTADMKDVLIRCMNALKNTGYMYASWKYGSGERLVDGRLYSDYNEESITNILTKIEGLKIISIWKTGDVRDNNATVWLNVMLQKIIVQSFDKDERGSNASS